MNRNMSEQFSIFNSFNNHTIYTNECISWIIQSLIILMHGVIMKIVCCRISKRHNLNQVSENIVTYVPLVSKNFC